MPKTSFTERPRVRTAPRIDPAAAGAAADPAVFRPALRPNRTLLVIAAAALGLWLAFLVYLYVTTVYPRRGAVHEPLPRPAAGQSDLSVPEKR